MKKSILISIALLGISPNLLGQGQEDSSFSGYLTSQLSLQKRLGHHLGGEISIKHKAWDIDLSASHSKHTDSYQQIYRSLPPLAPGHKALTWVADTDETSQAYSLSSTLGYSINSRQRLELSLLYENQYEDTLMAEIEAQEGLGSTLLPSYRAKQSNTLASPYKQKAIGLTYTTQWSSAWQFEGELSYQHLSSKRRSHSLISPNTTPQSTREQEGLYTDLIPSLAGRAHLSYQLDDSRFELSYNLNYREEELGYRQSNLVYQSLLPFSEKEHKAEEQKWRLSWAQDWSTQLSTRVGLGLRSERRSWADIGSSSMLDLLPSLELSYRRDKWDIKLGYKKEIEMPKLENYDPRTYYLHEAWIQRNDPSLPSHSRDALGAELSYGSLSMELGYTWLKRMPILDFRSHSLWGDPLMGYYSIIDLSRYHLNLSYSTKVGIWQSSYKLSLGGQSLQYEGRHLNKPTWALEWENTLSLGKGWELRTKATGVLGGHELNQRLGDYYQIDFGLSKQFGKRLHLSLEVEDLTTTGQEESWVYTPKATLYSLNNSDYASYSFTLRYVFGKLR